MVLFDNWISSSIVRLVLSDIGHVLRWRCTRSHVVIHNDLHDKISPSVDEEVKVCKLEEVSDLLRNLAWV